jgi:hypothetical protein
MAKDIIYLGSVPIEEACEQASPENGVAAGFQDVQVYRKQLIRLYTASHGRDLTETGCKLQLKCEDHELGSYYEVVASFDVNDEKAMEAAFWFDANSPEFWDEISKKELGL